MQSTELVKIDTAAELFEVMQAVNFSYVTVAKRYVAALEVRPEIRTELETLGAPRNYLNRLEQLGRGNLHPRLLLGGSTQERSLALCPLSVQQDAIENGVEVLEPDSNDTRRIPLEQLTPQQARRCIRGGKLMTITEQRSLLKESQKVKSVSVDHWQVTKDCLYFHGYKLTKKQLLQALQEMN